MLTKEFWGLVFLAIFGWIFIAGSPSERIERGCAPVGWAGNLMTSAAALLLPNHQATIQGGFDKVEYGCRYLTWRLIYQRDWNARQAQDSGASPVLPSDEPADFEDDAQAPDVAPFTAPAPGAASTR